MRKVKFLVQVREVVSGGLVFGIYIGLNVRFEFGILVLGGGEFCFGDGYFRLFQDYYLVSEVRVNDVFFRVRFIGLIILFLVSTDYFFGFGGVEIERYLCDYVRGFTYF